MEFKDQAERFGPIPWPDVGNRMLDRANANPKDPELLYWASVAIEIGSCNRGLSISDGFALLQRSADMGYMPATRDLGFLICCGKTGSADDVQKGLNWLRKAADGGDPTAMCTMGLVLERGLAGFTADTKAAKQYFQRASDGGFAPAHGILALYEFREGEKEKAVSLWERAAKLGDMKAAETLLGTTQLDYGRSKPVQFRELLLRGALLHDVKIVRMLGVCVLQGGVKFRDLNIGEEYRDVYLAVNLLVNADDGGDIPAKVLLALARLHGFWWVPQQKSRGLRELTWLSNEADSSGCAAYCLGQALISGAGVERDANRGTQLVQRSADAGFAPAIQWLRVHESSSRPERSASSEPKDILPSVPSTGAPRNQAPDAGFEELRPVLELAGTRVDLSQKAGVHGPGSSMSAADQELEDNDRMEDSWRRGMPPPPLAVLVRIAERAKKTASIHTRTMACVAMRLGVAQDLTVDQCKQWLQEGANAGDVIAMVEYASHLLLGDWYKQDAHAAIAFLHRAADEGGHIGYKMLGDIYMRGPAGIPRDANKAVEMYKEACKKGGGEAFAALAIAAVMQGDSYQSSYYLTGGASQADHASSALLTWLYMDQLPVEPVRKVNDEDVMRSVFLRGALCGCSASLTEMALRLGGDATASRRMLHEAARAGDHRAKAIFASALITGEYGVALDVDRGLVDLEELIATKEIAAGPVVSILEMRIGQAEANWRLGRLLYEGKYLPGDKRRGRELIEKSAAKGNRDAARWLARLAIGNDTP